MLITFPALVLGLNVVPLSIAITWLLPPVTMLPAVPLD
jgi:hypothetical protein